MFEIKSHKVPQLGWFEVKLEKDVIDYLWKIINKSTKNNYKSNLAGNISRSYSLVDENNIFFNKVLLPIITEWRDNNGKVDKKKLMMTSNNEDEVEIYLDQFWVNYQHQHEFNPYHDHSGLFSFAIWLKIPYDWREQNQLSFINGVKDSEKKPGCFEFEFLDMYGEILNYAYRLDPSREGTMLFFPAELRHTVYPFYKTEEPRISIAGNISARNK